MKPLRPKRQAREISIGIIVLLVNLLVIVFIFIIRPKLPPIVPLYYGLPQGESQLASHNLLITPSVLAIIIALINTLISYFTKDDFIKNALLAAMILATIFSTITVIKISFLVGNL